ncbi:MAG: N-acetylmuramic acid 6-phosphate etherase [Verrucomicrobia bacterium]|nr:N-acetylmuramic acid 6-phosphate etherase [Verrucomicrobiota bacterium]
MTQSSGPTPIPPAWLGIECGATRSVALFVHGGLVRRAEGGPANLRLLSDSELLRRLRTLREVHAGLAAPAAVAIGMAGARTAEDRARITRAAAKLWPGVPCRATNDLETALAAATEHVRLASRGSRPRRSSQSAICNLQSAIPQVLVLSGTGSCCFGRRADGTTARVGGWGHLLGDRGSGYDIGLRALQETVHHFDRHGRLPLLGEMILRSLLFNSPEELIGWTLTAGKNEIAALAVEVFGAAGQRDAVARGVLQKAADSLASCAADCAARLAKRGVPVQFVLAGSVLLKQPRFAQQVARQIQQRWPSAVVVPLKREGAWGAIELARELALGGEVQSSRFKVQSSSARSDDAPSGLESLAQSPTEQRNPRSMNLDQLPLREAIALMLSEDAKLPAGLLAEIDSIERALRHIVRSLRQGGRLLYVGAGTSGRLGVLDASECPPTFRTSPDQVQGIMAGGQTALWRSLEGAEDDAQAGAGAISSRNVTARDTVVGIAASGRTPFVWGALGEAKRRGAGTVLLCFNPFLSIPPRQRPSVVIAPDVGPEVLTGSSRLKAGTATKLVLNILTTLAMVQLGKVDQNLMVDMNPSNAKLRDRAIRIVRELTGADDACARAALERSRWVMKEALRGLRRSVGTRRRFPEKA